VLFLVVVLDRGYYSDNMTHYWTTAPESYDYSYTTTTAVQVVGNKTYRLVETSDPIRFDRCQIPRYQSGFHAIFEQGDAREALLGLKHTEANL